MSPTALSLRELRRMGYIGAVVEKFNPGARVRQDLFGIVDILALAPRGEPNGLPRVTGIQACATGDISKRVAKILAAPTTRVWLDNQLGLVVWGWSKKGKRGKRKTWQLTRRDIYRDQLPVTVSALRPPPEA